MAMDAEPTKIERIADSVTTRLLARLSMIALLPIVVWLFLKLWDTQDQINEKLHAIDVRLGRVETRLDYPPQGPIQRASETK